MYGSSRIRWIGFGIAIFILLILSVWGVFSIAKNLFKGNADTPQTTEVRKGLDQYNRPGANVIFEVQGPVVANTEHLSYRITVGRTERIFQIIRGYEGVIESEQRYDNNEEAYLVFLKALDGAGFDSKNKSTTDDERGACALGRRYVYRIDDYGQEVFRSWNASCSPDLGTSDARNETRVLFQKQIPEFSKLVFGTGLR